MDTEFVDYIIISKKNDSKKCLDVIFNNYKHILKYKNVFSFRIIVIF